MRSSICPRLNIVSLDVFCVLAVMVAGLLKGEKRVWQPSRPAGMRFTQISRSKDVVLTVCSLVGVLRLLVALVGGDVEIYLPIVCKGKDSSE